MRSTRGEPGGLVAALVNLWADTFGCECDEDSDLFELGGDSLTIMRMLGPVNELAGTDVSFGAVLDAPTPGELAALLAGRYDAGDRE